MSWEFFKHYLLSRRAGALIRTVAWLCMSGVGIGVMALIVVIGVMNGFNEAYKKRLLGVEPHLVVRFPDVKKIEDLENKSGFIELKNRADLQVNVFENQDIIIRTADGLFSGAVAKGLDEKSIANLSKNPLDLQEGDVALGIDLARSLGVFEGDRVTLIPPEALLLPEGEVPPFIKVRVRRLLSTNVPQVDEKAVFFRVGATMGVLRESLSRDVGIEVRLKDPENFEDLRKWIEVRGGVVQSWIDRNSSLFYALRMEKIAMGSFLGLSALIASFSIVTVLTLLLIQKRKDIGILMGIGLSPKKAKWLFVRVGLILSYFGIGAGIIFGVLICFVLDRFQIPILPDIYYDRTIPAKVEPLFIAAILLSSLMIAFVSSYLPASSITNEMPADAITLRRRTREAHR